MHTLMLRKCDDGELHSFAESLSSDKDEICIDFQNLPFLIPAAVLTLLVKIKEWVKEERSVKVRNHTRFTYLQRMDFFKYVGLKIEEPFRRHNANHRFVPISKIESDTGTLATNIADCLFPEQSESSEPDKTGVYDYLYYAITELANNVIQHSKGAGFCFAQKFTAKRLVRFAIADNGIGIKNSLEHTPYFKDTNIDSIYEALKPHVSGSAHMSIGESVNAGVGLSLLVEIAKLTSGYFAIYSGDGFLSSRNKITLNTGIQGTICGFTFPQQSLDDKGFFQTVLQEAKKNLGLLGDNKFEGVFI